MSDRPNLAAVQQDSSSQKRNALRRIFGAESDMDVCGGDDKAGPVAIGAKGTIVSLMEKELELQESLKASKLPPQSPSPAPQLQIRNEAVSVYCGFASNAVKGNKSSPTAESLVKSGSLSCRDCSNDVKTTRPGCYSKDGLGRSSSLRNSRSKEAKVLHFSSPKSGAPRRKVVSYHEAASSGMLSFVGNDRDSSKDPRRSQRIPAVDDTLIPILSPDRPKFHNVSSPGKFSVVSPVQIVDTRCYRGGRELFRPLPKSSAAPKKQLNFWRL